MKGNLAKAPRFDNVEGFDKSDFSLWKVHTHIDTRGFLWVNLDGSEMPTLSWEEQFSGVDKQDRLGDFDMDNYIYDHTWSMEGKFNWKTLIENYNEVSTGIHFARARRLNILLVLSLPNSPPRAGTVLPKQQEDGVRVEEMLRRASRGRGRVAKWCC